MSVESAYNRARKFLEEFLGYVPENYVINFFYDDTLFDSVLLQTMNAGTPNAVISSNEVTLLKEIIDQDYVPNGRELFFAGRKSRIYLPGSRASIPEDALTAKFVQLLAMSALCEKTVSELPDIGDKIFKYDAIIRELFNNNVYELVRERGSAWAWQYFQDFVASLRLLASYDLADYYVPPDTMRETSVFYNFLLEIKEITLKRAKTERKAPIWELVLHGFGTWVLREYLTSLDELTADKIKPHLKSNLGLAYGEIGAEFLRWNTELEGNEGRSVFEIACSLPNDYELIKHWSRGETKTRLENLREKLSNEAVVWHRFKEGYWADLWPVRGINFDRIADLVGKLQRRKYSRVSQLLLDKPTVEYHGRVILSDREVAVYSIQEDTVGQEQLIVLRNHLVAMKGEFATPLPGLPDVIVFKKYAGMHVASYLGVKNSFNYPRSPYDLPIVTRAVQVTKKRGAYLSEEREETGKIELGADYSNIKNLSEPQRRAIQYLLRQLEVKQ